MIEQSTALYPNSQYRFSMACICSGQVKAQKQVLDRLIEHDSHDLGTMRSAPLLHHTPYTIHHTPYTIHCTLSLLPLLTYLTPFLDDGTGLFLQPVTVPGYHAVITGEIDRF